MKLPHLTRWVAWAILVVGGFLLAQEWRSHRKGPEPVTGFLDAIVAGRSPLPYMYGGQRAVLDTNHFTGMTGYRVQGRSHNVVITEIQFPAHREIFHLHLLHGLVGRVEPAERSSCSRSRGLILRAKAAWARQHGKTLTDQPTWEELQPHFPAGASPTCPAGGAYTLGAVKDPTRCSLPGDHWGPGPRSKTPTNGL